MPLRAKGVAVHGYDRGDLSGRNRLQEFRGLRGPPVPTSGRLDAFLDAVRWGAIALADRTTDIEAVREAHVEVDEAVAEVYGWTDLDLCHDFHETRQGMRFTIDPVVQSEVLDRLLELNHARDKEEQATGIRLPSQRKKATQKRKRSEPAREEEFQDGLFAHPDGLF